MKSFNVQTYIDARLIAGLARSLVAAGLEDRSLSGVVRIILEKAHKALESQELLIPFDSTEEAIDYLNSAGFSVKQLKSDKSRRAILHALQIENMKAESGEKNEPVYSKDSFYSPDVEKALKELEGKQ